ncbi:MAG: DUF4115 domain-containing protein [Candidatus Aminicenantes bacterium]|nr:DUF4115 domain-containing protein [Candidatus Aminicenantes bacterium]
MNSVGQELKKERELRGISLKEIADNTKVSIRYLRALEEDKFDILPGKFFIKSIIKTYSDYIGLDQEAILDQFHHTIQMIKQESSEPEVKEEDEVTPTEIPRRFKILLRIAGYLIIAILSVVIVLLLIRSHRSATVDESTISSELPLSKKQLSPELNALIPYRKMRLKITFRQETWIEIFCDQELHFSGLKQPGESLSATAENEFLIHVGNAGGLSFSINGREGKSLGKSGDVLRNLKITSDNYNQYLTEQSKQHT